MNQDGSAHEQQQAERLERYLSALEQGKILKDDPTFSERSLFRFARELKTVAQPIQPSITLLEAIQPTPTKWTWSWLLPLPVVGTAIAAAFFFFQSQKSITNTTTVSTDILLTEEVAKLDQLESDLAVVTDQLDGQISSIDFYTADEGIEQL